MYPWAETPCCHPDFLLRPERQTLRDNDHLLGWFNPNPADCARCLKPLLKHQDIPDATFTILVACHHSVAAENMFPNKSVAALLPADQLQYTPLGNLVVVKHRLPSPDASPVSNADLPLDDIVPADFPYVDEMVRWYVLQSTLHNYLTCIFSWCYQLHVLAWS
jgi:hypothetical protein